MVLFHFFSVFKQIAQIAQFANSTDPDQTPHNVASDLGLRCLPMSHKKDTRLKWVYKHNMHIFFPNTMPSLPAV